MKRLLGITIALLGIGISHAAADGKSRSSEQAKGTIAFSSLAPTGWDLYRNSNGADSRLTQHRALDFNAAFSSDGRKIAFVSDRDGNLEIYVMSLDGSERRRLTKNFSMEDHPTWSPDGKQIAFVSTRQPSSAGRAWNAIYVINVDGSNVNRISPDEVADYSPAWSPRGDLIAFASGSGQSGQSDIYVMKPDGQGRRLIVKNGGWPAFIAGGKAIAFHSRRERGDWSIWSVNTDGYGRLRIKNVDRESNHASGHGGRREIRVCGPR